MRTQADLSLTALFDALDEQRRSRNMSWAAVTKEFNARARDVPERKPIAASTIAGLTRKTVAEGDGILQMLLWLHRSPESFVPGHGDADTARYQLRVLGTTQILRWDTNALYSALNAQRQTRAMTWQEVGRKWAGSRPRCSLASKQGGAPVFRE